MTITVNNGIIIQTVDTDGALAKPLTAAGNDIKKVLVKKRDDGTDVIVPPCESSVYSIMLDREIEAAKELIEKPSFGKSILYAIVGIVLLAMFGDWFMDMDGFTYFALYGGMLAGSVFSYIGGGVKRTIKIEALATIRGILMEDYINHSCPQNNSMSENLLVSNA